MTFKSITGALARAPPGLCHPPLLLLDSTAETHLYGIDYHTTEREPTSQAYCDFWDEHHKKYDTQYECASDGMVHVRWPNNEELNDQMNQLLDESLALWGQETGCAVGDDH